MSFFKKLYNISKKSIKFSAINPSSFVEVWSFTSTRIRVLSLFLVFLALFSLVILLSFGSVFSSYTKKSDIPIERSEVLELRSQVEEMKRREVVYMKYNVVLKKVLSGEVPVSVNLDSLTKKTEVNYDNINTSPSDYEKELSKKVKDDMRTNLDQGVVIPYFKSPVKGVVSQKFSKKTHPGIDVVTEKDHTVKACLSGTVIYSGYTMKDGYILIIDHGNEYMSVYKHNKKALKKMGSKIQLGDPIAIVGNTGENTDGPHLHFELWYNQTPVDPEDYLTFKR